MPVFQANDPNASIFPTRGGVFGALDRSQIGQRIFAAMQAEQERKRKADEFAAELDIKQQEIAARNRNAAVGERQASVLENQETRLGEVADFEMLTQRESMRTELSKLYGPEQIVIGEDGMPSVAEGTPFKTDIQTQIEGLSTIMGPELATKYVTDFYRETMQVPGSQNRLRGAQTQAARAGANRDNAAAVFGGQASITPANLLSAGHQIGEIAGRVASLTNISPERVDMGGFLKKTLSKTASKGPALFGGRRDVNIKEQDVIDALALETTLPMMAKALRPNATAADIETAFVDIVEGQLWKKFRDDINANFEKEEDPDKREALMDAAQREVRETAEALVQDSKIAMSVDNKTQEPVDFRALPEYAKAVITEMQGLEEQKRIAQNIARGGGGGGQTYFTPQQVHEREQELWRRFQAGEGPVRPEDQVPGDGEAGDATPPVGGAGDFVGDFGKGGNVAAEKAAAEQDIVIDAGTAETAVPEIPEAPDAIRDAGLGGTSAANTQAINTALHDPSTPEGARANAKIFALVAEIQELDANPKKTSANARRKLGRLLANQVGGYANRETDARLLDDFLRAMQAGTGGFE